MAESNSEYAHIPCGKTVGKSINWSKQIYEEVTAVHREPPMKSEPLRVIDEKDGVVQIEGFGGSSRCWFGKVSYRNEHDDTTSLKLFERTVRGHFKGQLEVGDVFGYGTWHGNDVYNATAAFGVVDAKDDTKIVWYMAGTSPQNALEYARDEGEEYRHRLPLSDLNGQSQTRTMISGAMLRMQKEEAKPVNFEHVNAATSGVMYSSAHAHPLEVDAARPEAKPSLWTLGTSCVFDYRRTKGGIERANVILKQMRIMAQRARKGIPWANCAEGEPENICKEYKMTVRLNESCTGLDLFLVDQLTSHRHLNLRVSVQAPTISEMCKAIESLQDVRL